ncbi:MAG TPA: ATP-binding protein [Salinivirgaceae bacterium]|nr:ATP-binding protein [Salinivirgaceae bacterium]
MIKNILSTTESSHIERTTSTNDMDKFCQAICAFSNDVSGSGKNGYLVIGAHDDGKLSGLKVNDKLLLKISNIRTDGNILPQPVMNVAKFTFDEGDLLVAEVQPSEFPPVRYRGRVWVRVGPRKSVATEAEEKILTERRLSNIHTFDAMPCLGTTINDLDVTLIEKEYLPKAVAKDILAEDKRNIEEQLASLGFFDLRYNCPTNGAIVLFGRNPERYLHGSYIQYVRFEGNDRAGDILNEHKFAGNLCRELPKIDTFIETSIAQKRPIPVSILREETFSKYPYWATRELLMNAIMHRDYETNAPVQFYEYEDKIEVQNPGGLYGKVTPDNFPRVSDYRNPFIAEAMKVMGYVNRFSRGIHRVQKELIENGNGEAIFDLSLVTAFRVIENISLKYFDDGFRVETPRAIYYKSPRKAQETTQEKAKKLPKKSQKNYPRKAQETTQEKILEAIRNKPEITQREIAQTIGITIDGIKYHIKKMTQAGIIKHEGPTKSGKWVIINE